MKISNRKDLQQIAIDHSADIDYKDFLKIYRNCTNEPYFFLTIDTTLPADNPLDLERFFQILLNKNDINRTSQGS